MTDLQQLPRDARRDGIKKLVVGAVVHSAGRVLILRRSATDQFMAGIEELPSGGVEPGENLITALARELAEEIGWADIPPPDQGFTGSFDYLSGSGRKTRQYTFALAYDATPIILSGEHTAYRWIDPADLGDTDLTGETAQIVRDWAQSRHRPASVLSLCPRRRGRDGCPCPARTGHRWPRTPIATASRKVAGRPAARQMVLTQRWTPRRSFRRARAIAYETQAPATLDRPVALTRPASVPYANHRSVVAQPPRRARLRLWDRDERWALRWLARSAGAACQMIYLPIDRNVQLARIAHRQATVPYQTFPMSEADLDLWREQFRVPDAAELGDGEIPRPPAGWPGWAEWAADHWPSCTEI